MKRKSMFTVGLSLLALSLFPIVSCASYENENSEKSMSQNNSIKDMIMNVGSKYEVFEDNSIGTKVLNIKGDIDQSKLTGIDYNDEKKWQELIFPNGNWKESDDYSFGKAYKAENFSNTNLFEKFLNYGKDFKNFSKEKIKPFDKKDINFNSIPNKYINGYAEIKTYNNNSHKRIYINLYFYLSNKKVWESTKDNYDILFSYTIFPTIENDEFYEYL